MKRALALLSIGLAGFCVADDTAPKIQYFSDAQLASQVAHPVEGIAAKQFLSGSGVLVSPKASITYVTVKTLK
jgi:hypothetical protein